MGRGGGGKDHGAQFSDDIADSDLTRMGRIQRNKQERFEGARDAGERACAWLLLLLQDEQAGGGGKSRELLTIALNVKGYHPKLNNTC